MDGGYNCHMPLVTREGIVVRGVGPAARRPMEEVAGLAVAACPSAAFPVAMGRIDMP